jgi:hypothetical protein
MLALTSPIFLVSVLYACLNLSDAFWTLFLRTIEAVGIIPHAILVSGPRFGGI